MNLRPPPLLLLQVTVAHDRLSLFHLCQKELQAASAISSGIDV